MVLGGVISESAFAAAGVGFSKFPHVSKIEEDPPMSFADVERSQYQDVWNGSDYAEFSGLWNSNAYRRLKKGELPKNANVVTGKWVRNWKTDDRGNVIKPKSRMVARGFGQIHNVDFSEAFAPTPSTASVKIAVVVANEKGWLLWHLDVQQAFIQAHLDEAVYMRLPAGCGDMSGEVVLLQRAVYGLRQAGRQWSLRLSRVLLQTTGMEQSKADPLVFRKAVDGEVTLVVCIHVDDLAVTAKDQDTFDCFYAQLKEEFPVSDMGDLSWCLGCAFERDRMKGVVKMTQTAFVDLLVDRFDLKYETQTPASVEFDLGPKIIHEKEGDWPYKQAVGGLLWISGMTRPDIASAVRAVARHAHNPAAWHWKAVRKIIAYLKATKDLGVVFRWGGDLKLSLFADADYADKCNVRRSVSSVAVMLGNAAVSASSTTQHCVTLSTSEAEYDAMTHGAKTALATKAVLDFVQPHLSGRAIDMYDDNEGENALAENLQSSHRSKHIDVRFHFLLGLVRLGQVTIHSVASAEQHAAILTKPLGRQTFRRHRDFRMNLS